MEQFSLLLPEGKPVSCLEDLSLLTVKERKRILLAYKEKVSGVKADLILRAYALFSRFTSKKAVPQLQKSLCSSKIMLGVLIAPSSFQGAVIYLGRHILEVLRASLLFNYTIIW